MNKLKSSLLIILSSFGILTILYIIHVRKTPEYQPLNTNDSSFRLTNHSIEEFTKSIPQVLENKIDLLGLSAKQILVANLNSGQILADKNPNDRIAIASLNKLMTILTILSLSSKNDIVTIPEYNYSAIPEYKAGIIAGEEYYRNDLIAGMLIASSNDIAYALAVNYGGDLANFGVLMNQTAKELGLTSSNFINPAGLDEENQYSNLVDLYRIVRYIWVSPGIQLYAGSQNKTINSIKETGNNQKHTIELKTSNQLIGKNKGVIGLKTGTTQQALECLITIVEKNSQQYMIILAGSQNRYQDTLEVISKL